MYDKFMKLCICKSFKKEEALELFSQMDVSQPFIYSPQWNGKVYSPMYFTPLCMAVFYNNLPMLNLLLSMGANPNIVYNECENVLWDLQYNTGETIAENENRLNMARCLLENGANPKVVVEGEDLYHYVLSCSQDDMGDLAEYRARFLDLLEEFIDD